MKKYLSLVKFSHTVFAMPFALLSYTLAVHAPGQAFSWRTVLLVVLCMIFARNTAMAFNRWTDRAIDADNPRTAVRDIPAGKLSERAALRFALINAVLFVASAFAINALCGLLAPVALAVIMGYSYTKRFTALCHLVLGAGLALAPIGAWLAVTGGFDPEWQCSFGSVASISFTHCRISNSTGATGFTPSRLRWARPMPSACPGFCTPPADFPWSCSSYPCSSGTPAHPG